MGHRQVQEDMGVMVLTESRRRACASSEAQRTWRASRSRTAVTCIRWRGRIWSTLPADGLMVWVSKPSDGWFTGLGLKTRVEVPRRDGRHMVASGSLHRGEAIDEKARWPSDQDYTGLDNNALGLSGSTHLYPGAKLGMCNSPVK